jgi:hypothetical protein
LFYYKRKKFDDATYNTLVNEWLTKLLRIRLSTSNDLDFLFYLNQHIFNLQSPSIKQFTHLLSLIEVANLTKHNMDHVLEKFLKFPLLFTYDLNKTRRLFLTDDLQPTSFDQTAPVSTQAQNDNNWLFIDLDGDCENMDQVLIDLNEDDLINIYYKIPFYTLYNQLWSLLATERDHYTTVKCMAFTNYVIKITFLTIVQYNKLKYKNFLKLCANSLNESLKFYKLLVKINADVYQHYYNKHILSIYVKFLYSTKLRSMRFAILSLMNTDFNLIALNTKWFVLCALCGIDVLNENFKLNYDSDEPMRFISDSIDFYLEDNLKNFTDFELVSFLKIINLISTSTDHVNEHFFRCLCKVLFKISFIYPKVCDVCHKEGKSLKLVIFEFIHRL